MEPGGGKAREEELRLPASVDRRARPRAPTDGQATEGRAVARAHRPGGGRDRRSRVWPRCWGGARTRGRGSQTPVPSSSFSRGHSSRVTDDSVCGHAVRQPVWRAPGKAVLDSSQPVGSALACPLFPETSGGHVSSGRGALGSPGASPRAEPAKPTQHTPQGSTASLPCGSRTDPRAERTRGARASWPAAVWTLCPVTSRGNDVAPQGVPTQRGCDGKGRQGLHAFTAPQTGSTSRTFHHNSEPPSHRGPSCHWPLRLPRPQPSPASPLLTTKTTARCSGAESGTSWPDARFTLSALASGRESPSRQVFADEFLPLPPALCLRVPGTRA